MVRFATMAAASATDRAHRCATRIVGPCRRGATQFSLRRVLYGQLDQRLIDADQHARFTFDRPPSPGRQDQSNDPPPGSGTNWLIVEFTSDGYEGGRVAYSANEGNYFGQLPSDAEQRLRDLPTSRGITTADLGSLGDYRVVSSPTWGGAIIVTGIPLADTRSVLLMVAAVTGGTLVMASILAGWAGAFLIRRALQPLDRVVATATRVTELKLDSGDVDLSPEMRAADTDERTEVGRVGAALNRMLEHVREALEFRHSTEVSIRQFVADASHELRTPLSSILGYAELNRRARHEVPAEVGHMLSRIESEAKRMKVLVEDMLLLASLDAGWPLAQDSVDLTALIINAVSDAHAAGPLHDWRLDLPETPVVVTGDSTRLEQILANLLTNARVHTPDGTTVTAGITSTATGTVIKVTDNGPGIPTEKVADIFERFVRGDSSRSRAAGSTGLGLAIVQAVTTAHGGQVSVTSQEGQTRFLVLLPHNRNDPTGANTSTASPPTGGTVLN